MSLPGIPERSIKIKPLAVIPLEGRAPDKIHPGMSGNILAFKNEKPSGVAILNLDKPKLSILPGTKDKNPDRTIAGTIEIAANAHSVYVSDGFSGKLKRFDISSQKMVTERSFQMEKHWPSFWVLTSSAATTAPLILAHSTEAQFLSPDLLLPKKARLGPQAEGASATHDNSTSYLASPDGSIFLRDGCLWQYRSGELVSRDRFSMGSHYSTWLSYNGALRSGQNELVPLTSKSAATREVLIPAITRPLCFASIGSKPELRSLSNKMVVYRNQGTTELLDITLPSGHYSHQFISFAAKRLVAISTNPVEIQVYEFDLERALQLLEAPPWIEVTGPGYVTPGRKATFQMRPVFGKFKSLKLIKPEKGAAIKGRQIIFYTPKDAKKGPRRIAVEYQDKEGRSGVTFLDVNVLEELK